MSAPNLPVCECPHVHALCVGDCHPRMYVEAARLTCCGGIYAHLAHCANHRHSFDGPRNCRTCRETPR